MIFFIFFFAETFGTRHYTTFMLFLGKWILFIDDCDIFNAVNHRNGKCVCNEDKHECGYRRYGEKINEY